MSPSSVIYESSLNTALSAITKDENINTFATEEDISAGLLSCTDGFTVMRSISSQMKIPRPKYFLHQRKDTVSTPTYNFDSSSHSSTSNAYFHFF